MKLRKIEDGLAEGVCSRGTVDGRGGCNGFMGHVYWAGWRIALKWVYVEEPEFQPAPGIEVNHGLLRLPERVRRQRRNFSKIATRQDVKFKPAWDRRARHDSWEAVGAAVTGRPLQVSDHRLPPINPIPAPVRVKCPDCGFVNEWDGSIPE